MTDKPTRDQITEAHDILDWIAHCDDDRLAEEEVAAIRRALPPKPPTYEELEAQLSDLEVAAEVLRNLVANAVTERDRLHNQVKELQAKLDATAVVKPHPDSALASALQAGPPPLPAPASCKPGEWYMIRDSDGYILPMQRDATLKNCPWTCGDWGAEDYEIEILARLFPDREVQA